MKKIIYYLKLYDGIWSIPGLIFAFWIFGLLIQTFFGYGAGTYDIGFFHPLLLASGIIVGATFFANIGLKFTFKTLHQYIYGKKQRDGSILNYSKKDFRSITPLQRIYLALIVYLFFISAIVFVYSLLI